MKIHKSSRNANVTNLTKASSTVKRKVIDATAFALAFRILSLSFSYEKKGMLQFAQVLVNAGRSVPCNIEVDVGDLLPCDRAVRAGVSRIAKSEREKFRNIELSNVMASGGGVTYDVR
ncbi:hypothetical protein FGB62_24g216 [Gracilaria domingensis]|nr:hypothetical protein FGB62_24g216 [Gracilaria domingensis]